MASTRPIMTLESAIELLTSIMQEPRKVRPCCLTIGLAADRIDQALEACESISGKIKLVKSFPELLRAGIKFLTHNQPREEHKRMVEFLANGGCSCDLDHEPTRLLHNPTRRRPDGRVDVLTVDLVFDAVTTVCNCIILALSDLTQHKFYTGQTSKGELRWPQGFDDLFPFGLEDSVEGLQHWVTSPPLGYMVFKLAGRLAQFNVQFAKAIFQHYKFVFTAFWPFQHIEEAITFYREGDTSVLARTHLFKYPVMTIFEFYMDLLQCETATFNSMFIKGGKDISPILRRLSRILSLLPAEWNKTRLIIQHITFYANADYDNETGVALIKFENRHTKALSRHDRLEHAFESIVAARKKGCWNIKCPSMLESVHSRLCSKCDLLRFCNEQCQREAWKSDKFPHKTICAKIHSIRDILGQDDWSLIWTPDYSYAKFRELCTRKNVYGTAMKEIARTISSLKTEKSTYMEETRKAGKSEEERLKDEEWHRLGQQKMKENREAVGTRPNFPFVQGAAFFDLNADAYYRRNI